MLPKLHFNESIEAPIYRQLFDQIRDAIRDRTLEPGERLPATRTLADQLGLNRQTISSAYELLETEGFITGQVGRGSFVALPEAAAATDGGTLDWARLLLRDGDTPPLNMMINPPAVGQPAYNFTASRPSELLFPLDEFRATCAEVIGGPEAADILQLGSASGYRPLRTRLLADAKSEGIARPGDDILITNGCQQALDLIQRVLGGGTAPVAVEDPVYPGLKNVFALAGTRLIGVPVTRSGIDTGALGRVLLRERPRMLVLTPSFQNPTGATMPLEQRKLVLRMAREAQVVVVENDIYGELRYGGDPLPTLKQLDEAGDVVLLRSFSKLAFPGLRVGWVIGPRALTGSLSAAKQCCDLHTDQLSQAVLLRFVESGRMARHRAHVVETGRERLECALAVCGRVMPAGTQYASPEGGMNLWITLPGGLDAGELLSWALREGVAYLPGKYFTVTRDQSSCLRISFAGLEPDAIRRGLEILGSLFTAEAARARDAEPATVFV